MTTITSWIAKHAALTYFALTFAISWGGVLAVVGPGGFPGTGEQFARLFPFAVLAMLPGPPVAGILMTALVEGRAGFRELLTRLRRWRVGVRWYLVALLTAPAVFTAVLLALSVASPAFLPGVVSSSDKAALVTKGVVVALAAGFCEEIGWTGFATPRLRRHAGVMATGLVVGSLWGAWHVLVNVWASGSTSGSLSLAVFLPAILLDLLIGVLAAFRILMVWVYDQTGSLLVATLMHASLTACTLILGPVAISGTALLTYEFVLAAVMWLVVAAVATAKGSHWGQTGV